MLTSQLPVTSWHKQIGDPTIADSILDRLVHNAYRFELYGESMRKKQGRPVMSRPPLVLKQSTGWFAAGWQFGEAIDELSDAAFKLFAWLCLNADRHTGRVQITRAGALVRR